MTDLKKDTFKRYLYYLVRKNLLRDIILAFISIIVLLTNLRVNCSPQDCRLGAITFVCVTLSSVMPMLTFSKFNNKRNLDVIYSLPLDRNRLALAHLTSGGFSILCIYSLCFVVFLTNRLLNRTKFNIEYVLLYFPVLLLYCLVIYCFFSFIFTKANTTFDGVVFCICWTITAFCIMFALCLYIYVTAGDVDNSMVDNSSVGIIFTPIITANQIFTKLSKSSKDFFDYIERYPHFYYGYPIWIIIGSGSLVGIVRTFSQKAAYKAGEISNSIFGYKFLIPAMGFSLMYVLSGIGTIIVSLIFYIGMVIGYAIYRRGFKFKKSDIIILVIGLLVLLKWAFLGGPSFNQY